MGSSAFTHAENQLSRHSLSLLFSLPFSDRSLHTSSQKGLPPSSVHTVYDYGYGHTFTSFNGASLLLELGDEVRVKLRSGALVCNGLGYTTFSGHLLFPMYGVNPRNQISHIPVSSHKYGQLTHFSLS